MPNPSRVKSLSSLQRKTTYTSAQISRTLSAVIGTLKSKSAKALLDKYGSFFWRKNLRTVWSSGFFLCSVGGATLEILKAYIENQGKSLKG